MAYGYLFPFQKVEKGAKIVLYGAGYLGRNYYAQCLSTQYCQILLWIDTNYQRYIYEGLPVFPPERISNVLEECDYVVIAVLSQISSDEVKDTLLNLGVKKEKIICDCQPALTIWQLLPDWRDFKTRFELPPIVCSKEKTFVTNIDVVSSKISVRCIYGQIHKCNAVYSVYKAFASDERFDAKIIGCDKKRGDVIPFSEYDVENDKIDILIVAMYELQTELLLKDINKIFESLKHRSQRPLLCCIPFSLLNLHGDTQKMMDRFLPYFEEFQVDYCLFDKFVYDEIYEKGYVQSGIIQCFGNPKFDRIFDKIYGRKEYPAGWEKLKGKKVFLITTDHNVSYPDVSIDLYFKTYIEYFLEHEDCAMILRPHPLYFGEVMQRSLLSLEEIQNIKDYCKNTKNIIFDDLPDYGISYRLADFVVADVNCGIMFSALPLGKPIGVSLRFDKKPDVFIGKLLDAYYCYHSPKECVELFDMLASGEDPKKEKREAVKDVAYMHCDGKNGERIKEFLTEKYFEKFNAGKVES